MNLTVEQLLAQIIKFLETDQPNMAVLYMKKALELVAAQRVLASKSWDEVFEAAFMAVADAICEATDAVVDCFARVAAIFTAEPTRADFALAADL